jgi:hypothetical protein
MNLIWDLFTGVVGVRALPEVKLRINTDVLLSSIPEPIIVVLGTLPLLRLRCRFATKAH